MGSCVSKITITDDIFLSLKSNPNDKLLLSLCLHYDIYDKVSQKKIDELCQISLSTSGLVSVFKSEATGFKSEATGFKSEATGFKSEATGFKNESQKEEQNVFPKQNISIE